MVETEYTGRDKTGRVVRQFGEERVWVKLDNELSKMPVKKFPTDSGADICSVESITIPVGERRVIHTGLHLDIPYGFEIQVRSRSGLAAKNGVFVLNGVGTIDKSYTGEIMVPLQNLGDKDFIIDVGDRIAQIVLAPIYGCVYEQVNEIEDTDRNSGDFGSTGTK